MLTRDCRGGDDGANSFAGMAGGRGHTPTEGPYGSRGATTAATPTRGVTVTKEARVRHCANWSPKARASSPPMARSRSTLTPPAPRPNRATATTVTPLRPKCATKAAAPSKARAASSPRGRSSTPSSRPTVAGISPKTKPWSRSAPSPPITSPSLSPVKSS